MSHAADFIEEIWREVNAILQDLAHEATAREIVESVYRELDPGPARTAAERNDQLVALIDATRDHCVAHLLRLARQDLSTGECESRAGCLLLRFFGPQIRAAVRREIPCAHDFEPVVNDVRFRIWRALRTFEGGRGQLHYYVKRACESACADRGRRRRGWEEICDPNELPERNDDDNPEHTIVELGVFLRGALPLLPPNERQAMEAYLDFDCNLSAAASALDVPRQTLTDRFKAAQRRLSALWGLR